MDNPFLSAEERDVAAEFSVMKTLHVQKGVNVHPAKKIEAQGLMQKSFALYDIDTTFPDGKHTVARRYNDFLDFRDDLRKTHPECIVPPLPPPEAHLPGNARFSQELLDYRQRAFSHFILMIKAHPVLAKSEVTKKFLTETNYMPLNKDSSFKNIKTFISSKMNSAGDTDTFFSALAQQLEDIEKILEEFYVRAEVLYEKQHAEKEAYKGFPASLENFLTTENNCSVPGNCPEEHKPETFCPIGKKQICDPTEKLTTEYSRLLSNEASHFKDYVLESFLEIQSMKEVLEYRQCILREFRSAEKSVHSATAKVEKGKGKATNAATQERLQQTLEAAEKAKTTSEEALSKLEKELGEEFQRTKKLRTEILKNTFEAFIKLNFVYHMKTHDIWINAGKTRKQKKVNYFE